MEYVKCHNCGSDQSRYYASENGYTLVKCVECGLIYLNPRPDAEEIQDAHKLGVHRGEHDFDITGHFDKGKIRNYLKILRDFYTPEQLTGSSWLDVGCGHGEFLVALREFTNGNIQLRGLEPNVQKQISAQRQGLDVSHFDLATHEQRYDRISLLNVYGHLPDPVGMLSTVRTLLLPRGELLLETGDSADLSREEHYRPFYLPDHLHFASERIIVSLLKKAGYEIINIQKYAFVPANIGTTIKEFIKVFLPNKHSRLKYLVMYQKYARRHVCACPRQQVNWLSLSSAHSYRPAYRYSEECCILVGEAMKRVKRLLRKLSPTVYAYLRAQKLLFAQDSYLVVTGLINTYRWDRPCKMDGSPLPWMNYSVISFLEKRLTNQLRLFEYGSGYSTLFYAKLVDRVVSVESNHEWFQWVTSVAPLNVTVNFARAEDGDSYAQAIAREDGVFDIVVVDGIDRVNCIKNAVGHLSDRGVLILDDSSREEYKPGIEYIASRGFKRLDFEGIKPNGIYLDMTSIFYRQENCLGL